MGVGTLEDGTRIFGVGDGVLAEKAIMNKRMVVKLPDNIDDVVAAALPNAIIGSALALLFRAKFKAGEIVLINGATGFTGKLAVQLAKYYGAKKVIATGRNPELLQQLLNLGADKIISLSDSNENIIENIKEVNKEMPIDVVLVPPCYSTFHVPFYCEKSAASAWRAALRHAVDIRSRL